MGRLFFLLVTIALIVIAVIVAINNIAITTVDLYVESYEISLSIIILYSFIIGAFTTLIYLVSIIFLYKKRIRQMKLSLENNKQELDNLRRNPLRDGTE
ncbi:MAG: LapA family protein [Gammaproteobacteria bacterium]